MEQNEIRSTWAKVANRVEDVTNGTLQDFLNKNKPLFEKDLVDLSVECRALEGFFMIEPNGCV